MGIQQKVNEMLKMQKALDKSILKKKGVVLELSKLKMAFIDEVGELVHELKGDWCWWKDTQAPVNREKVLEELVDVWHFGLILYYTQLGDEFYIIKRTVNIRKELDLSAQLHTLLNDYGLILEYLIALGETLNFTFDEVYEAYIKKNKVNYERLESGY